MHGLFQNNTKEASVLVLGDIMLDRYFCGSSSRISPEAPVPIVDIEETRYAIGGAGNVALNLVGLGAKTFLLGVVGDDFEGNKIQELFGSMGVLHGVCATHRVRTTTKLRVLSREQQLLRLDFEGKLPARDAEQLLGQSAKNIPFHDVIVLSDYAKGALLFSEEMIRQANFHHKFVIVDPKGTDFARYKGADLITPNLSEFEAVVGKCCSEQDLVDKGNDLVHSLGLKALLITRSEHGMTLINRDEPPFNLPTKAQKIFDVTGAGDTVVSTIAAAIAAGFSLIDAVTLSNEAAGVVVAKPGTVSITFDELKPFLRN